MVRRRRFTKDEGEAPKELDKGLRRGERRRFIGFDDGEDAGEAVEAETFERGGEKSPLLLGSDIDISSFENESSSPS